MTIRALLFDVDGTLAETEELHRESFNDAFAGLRCIGWVQANSGLPSSNQAARPNTR